MPNRIPLNILYCVAVNCPYRVLRRCTQPECIRVGAEKWPSYFTVHGVLADGDVPDA